MKALHSHSIHQMQANAAAAETMLKELANAKRLLILCALVEGEKSAGSLSQITALSHSALSQHLHRLRKNGLVACDKRGQFVYYQLASPEVHALLATLYLIYCRPA